NMIADRTRRKTMALVNLSQMPRSTSFIAGVNQDAPGNGSGESLPPDVVPLVKKAVLPKNQTQILVIPRGIVLQVWLMTRQITPVIARSSTQQPVTLIRIVIQTLAKVRRPHFPGGLFKSKHP